MSGIREGWLSNYCGLGGSGIPQHVVDGICKEHDEDYQKITDSGKNPYTSFNWADAKMIKALQQHKPASHKEALLSEAARGIWAFKRAFLSNDPSLLNSPASAQAAIQTPTKRKREPGGASPQRSDKKRIQKGDPAKDMTKNLREANVEADGDMVMESSLSAAAPTSSGSKSAMHETPITKAVPTYGLPETHTCVLPFTMYFSGTTGATPGDITTTFSVRLNSIYDIFMNTLSAQTAGAAKNANTLYNKIAATEGQTNNFPATVFNFPAATSTGANTAEAPAFRAWFEKMYEVYTVLGVEYELTIHNPNRSVNGDIIVGYAETSFGSTSSEQQIPAAALYYMERWPGIKWQIIKSQGDGATDHCIDIIKGHYRPGQARRNVFNDEDIKTWTATSASPANFTEQLQVFFGKAPFNDTDSLNHINFRLHLRIICQFKDLKVNFRYPAGQSAVTLSAPADLIQKTG